MSSPPLRARRNLTLSWDDLAWLRGRWRGPLVIKGVLAVEDAERVADLAPTASSWGTTAGASSTARSPRSTPSSPIADAVGRRLVVIVDGGVRRGADVVKALALGARAVLLGRVPLYGVAVAGEPGAARAILRDELERATFFVGSRSVDALSRAYLRETGPRG